MSRWSLPAELADELLPREEVLPVSTEQLCNRKGSGREILPTCQSVGAGTPASLSTLQPPKWVQVTLSDTFFPTPHIFPQIKSDINEHPGQP